MIIAPVMMGPVMFTACCIRLESRAEGPYLHHNTAHVAVGITEAGISIDATGRLKVAWDVAPDGQVASAVTSFINADESFTRNGITAGGSGGNGEMTISFHKEGVVGEMLATDSRLYGTGRNLWCGFFTLPKSYTGPVITP